MILIWTRTVRSPSRSFSRWVLRPPTSSAPQTTPAAGSRRDLSIALEVQLPGNPVLEREKSHGSACGCRHGFSTSRNVHSAPRAFPIPTSPFEIGSCLTALAERCIESGGCLTALTEQCIEIGGCLAALAEQCIETGGCLTALAEQMQYQTSPELESAIMQRGDEGSRSSDGSGAPM